MRGRKPNPSALNGMNGNPGKRGVKHAEPLPPEGLPDCPPHLSDVAQAEWRRLAHSLYDMGVLTIVDRAALAAYCQSYAPWVEAEEKMRETPAMLRTPSGYVQQSPWMSVANKQLELMGRYMAELGMTPASRSRVRAYDAPLYDVIYEDADGQKRERPLNAPVTEAETQPKKQVNRYALDGRL